MIKITKSGADLLVNSFLRNDFFIHLFIDDDISELSIKGYESKQISSGWVVKRGEFEVIAVAMDYTKFEMSEEVEKIAGYYITYEGKIIWNEFFIGGAYYNLKRGDVINIKPKVIHKWPRI